MKTIKKLMILALTASFAVQVQAEGYLAVCKNFIGNAYTVALQKSGEFYTQGKTTAQAADTRINEYATQKQPWFKDHMQVLTGIKIGAALTSLVATCWTMKSMYNRLQALRTQKTDKQVVPVVQNNNNKTKVQSLVQEFEAAKVTYGAQHVQTQHNPVNNTELSNAQKAKVSSKRKPASRKPFTSDDLYSSGEE
jgi:hypothetical protein